MIHHMSKNVFFLSSILFFISCSRLVISSVIPCSNYIAFPNKVWNLERKKTQDICYTPREMHAIKPNRAFTISYTLYRPWILNEREIVSPILAWTAHYVAINVSLKYPLIVIQSNFHKTSDTSLLGWNANLNPLSEEKDVIFHRVYQTKCHN
jgi:hypothetical protein